MNTSKELTAEDIFGMNLEIEKLDIEHWNGHFYMRTFSGSDRAKFQSKVKSKNVNTGEGALAIQLWLIIYGICDSKGERVFKDDKATIEKLSKQNGAVLQAVAEKIMKYNCMYETQKQIELEAKNS